MDKVALRAVERAIGTMKANLSEPLTIDDLARSALFSKFHFSRVFQRVTGVSPGRFLSAVRLAEAKRLLLATSISVAAISHRVGYSSIGTFSSRFHSSVGHSPTAYRQLSGAIPRIPMDVRRVRETRSTVLRGHIRGPRDGVLGPVFVGLFSGRILQGQPVRCAVVHSPGPYLLREVPTGSWYLLAFAPSAAWDDEEPYVAHHGPITLHHEVAARLTDVRLRPVRALDPPVLLALPDLRAAGRQAFAG